MARKKPKNESQPERHNEGITRIMVGGFKSIAEEQSIEIRPLTILAGANSSGKSSIMQPLLLLKQTLEAAYDPDALLLNGPNVRFTLIDQLLSRRKDRKALDAFHVGIDVGSETMVTTTFGRSKNIGKGLDVKETVFSFDQEKYRLYLGMPKEELQKVLSTITEAEIARTLGFMKSLKKPDQFVDPNVTLSKSLFLNVCYKGAKQSSSY
ncbi:MAG: hypothetical protein NVSMB38_32340 [Ktedonobacteraceae bacterium]